MRPSLFVLLIIIGLSGAAQNSLVKDPLDKLTRAEYIETYAPFAVREMLQSGVPASITLSQGILESSDGNSTLAREANNHFGIKCHGIWEGKKYHMDDDAKGECFRVYPSVFDSYRDHSEFLGSRDRYASLFKLEKTDYKAWAQGLKDAGYATNPKYPALLIKIIEENELHRYDLMTEVPKGRPERTRDKNNGKNRTKPNSAAGNEAIVSVSERQMYLRNEVRYVFVEKGDTYEKLDRMLGVREWQIQKYNDKPKGSKLVEGELIYLQPKRARNRAHSYHFVAEGETLRWISQEYGIKMKSLYAYNELSPGEEPVVGAKVWLRKPRLRDY